MSEQGTWSSNKGGGIRPTIAASAQEPNLLTFQIWKGNLPKESSSPASSSPNLSFHRRDFTYWNDFRRMLCEQPKTRKPDHYQLATKHQTICFQ